MVGERRGRAWPVAWLHIGFALTGVGTNLFGCVLPALSSVWHLDDRQAGMLFAAQFTGSASGALLVGKDFFRSVVTGYLLLISSAIALAFFTGFVETAVFFSFGLGLGLTITSTNMLIGSALRDRRGSALSILNAVWGLGAVLSPVIAALWFVRWRPAYVFPALGAALTLTFLFIAINGASSLSSAEELHGSGGALQLKLISVLAVIAFLYVGTEVCVSGWMMSYVGRLPASSKVWAAAATSCFWIALLFGRTLVPLIVRWISESRLFTVSLGLAFIAVVLLILSRSSPAIVASAMLAGLALAPIFPLCFAKVLAVMRDSPSAKWVFSISGLGGAFLPWLTGELSAYSGSLRVGLLVPAVAVGAMLFLDRLVATWQLPELAQVNSESAAAQSLNS